MGYSNSDDYFGFATRVDFMDWAVAQFKEYANVEITDKSAMIYDEDAVQDGCCEICYSEDITVQVKYENTVLIYTGYYSYNGDDMMLTADYVPEVNIL